MKIFLMSKLIKMIKQSIMQFYMLIEKINNLLQAEK